MPSTPSYGSSGRYYKESSSSRKSAATSGRYSTGDRYYESKKPHGHSSMYNSQLTPSASSSHRYYSSGGAHSSERPSHLSRQKTYDSGASGGGVGRDFRRGSGNDYRKYYEKSSGSGVRRVPPPLTPPGPGLLPLMKVPVSSSSRYRQAPPEDHNHSYRRSSGSHSHSLAREKLESLRKATQRTAESVTNKIRKRAASDIHHGRAHSTDGESRQKRKREEDAVERPEAEAESEGDEEEDDENEEGEEIVVEQILYGDDGEEIEVRIGGELQPLRNADGSLKNPPEEKKEEKPESKPKKQEEEHPSALLKLSCTYCKMEFVSFRDFSFHLRSYQHNKVMDIATSDMKKRLIKLRESQREEQKKLEKSEDGKKTLSDTTSYCRVCELNFRTDPKEHEANPVHNELKGLVHPHCDTCDIDFRVWKVYMYHTVALEHVKKIAIKELKEQEASGNFVKGTNLTEKELGLELLELRTVFYCTACVRYFPIREGKDERDTKLEHCMTISHIKCVQDYRDRIRRVAKRQKEEEERKQREKERELEKEKEKEKSATDGSTAEGAKEASENKDEVDGDGETGENGETEHEQAEDEEHENEDEKVEKEEEDEDEIQIHAEEDDTVVTSQGDD